LLGSGVGSVYYGDKNDRMTTL